MGGFVDAGPADQLLPGQVMPLEIEGRRIGIYNAGGELYAMDDLCTHDQAYLSDGGFEPETKTVRCPRHSACFDLTTGRPKTLPAIRPARTYEARSEDGRIGIRFEN